MSNNPAHPSKTNDQGDIDIKYSHKLGVVDLSAYLQVMNEDSNPVLSLRHQPSVRRHRLGAGGINTRAHYR